MANTKSSTKRARQAKDRQARNTIVKSMTKTALKDALTAIQSKDVAKVKEAYKAAIRAVSKAASKGALPQGRASRKISRLTHFIKKTVPAALSTK